jgi:hypothetical protein
MRALSDSHRPFKDVRGEGNKARTASERSISEQIGALRVTHEQATVQQSSNSARLITILAIVLTAVITVACTLLGLWLTRQTDTATQQAAPLPNCLEPPVAKGDLPHY